MTEINYLIVYNFKILNNVLWMILNGIKLNQ